MDKQKPTRILCVEDDIDSCEMITFLLGQSGIKVVSAHTVSDALLLAEADSFDLYLLDSSFPDGTGIELCKKIRASDETTPIVFYSGMSDESTRESGLDAGAQAYLIKPQDLEKIEPVIKSLVEKQ